MITFWAPATGSLYSLDGMYAGSAVTPSSTVPVSGEWLQLAYSTAAVATSVTLGTFPVPVHYNRGPRRFVVLGGASAASFKILAEFSGVSWPSALLQTFSFANTEAFAIYRVVVLENNGGSGGEGWLAVSELQFSVRIPDDWGRNTLQILHPDGRCFLHDAPTNSIRLNTGDIGGYYTVGRAGQYHFLSWDVHAAPSTTLNATFEQQSFLRKRVGLLRTGTSTYLHQTRHAAGRRLAPPPPPFRRRAAAIPPPADPRSNLTIFNLYNSIAALNSTSARRSRGSPSSLGAS